LERLIEVAHENLIVQVSLDGGQPEHHDAYRGKGTWDKTVAGINNLLANGFRVRLGTTETPTNTDHLEELCAFHNSLGIPEEDHFVRPLARRGFSDEGLEVSMQSMTPEVTVNQDGVFWHPLSTDADMQVTKSIFPLAQGVECIQEQIALIAAGGTPSITFT
jgi:sulfatase maturation enzyme AslB (radical SAM superfamily)